MNSIMPVNSIMSKEIIAVTCDDNLEYAEILFKKYNIKHIPVVKEELIIGMLSYSDMLRVSVSEVAEDDHNIDSVVFNMFTIEQVMTKNVISITGDTSIKAAAEILSKRNINALPVLEEGVLVGIVTTTDILNFFIKYC